MKSTPFTEMATEFRGQIVRLWALQYPGTQSDKKQACTRSSVSHMVLEPGRNSVMGGSDGINVDARRRLEARK